MYFHSTSIVLLQNNLNFNNLRKLIKNVFLMQFSVCIIKT